MDSNTDRMALCGRVSRLFMLMIMPLLIGAMISCGPNAEANKTDTESTSDATEETTVPSIPDPSGTYSDDEGGLSFTFLSTGKFYSELLGETSFGTWTRSGSTLDVTYDDGNTAVLNLSDGYLEYNGLRLTK